METSLKAILKDLPERPQLSPPNANAPQTIALYFQLTQQFPQFGLLDQLKQIFPIDGKNAKTLPTHG
jgi:hypothetical protein